MQPLPNSIQPHTRDMPGALPMQHAIAWSGLSRSTLYREAGAGRLVFRKAGRTTLVDGPSLAALIASLPVATIRPQRAAAPTT
jgi:hypothetical protein